MNLNILKKTINLDHEVELSKVVDKQLQLCFVEQPKTVLKQIELDSALENMPIKAKNLSKAKIDVFLYNLNNSLILLLVSDNINHTIDEIALDIKVEMGLFIDNYVLLFSELFLYVYDLSNKTMVNSTSMPGFIAYFDAILSYGTINVLAMDRSCNLIEISIASSWQIDHTCVVTDLTIKKMLYTETHLVVLKYNSRQISAISRYSRNPQDAFELPYSEEIITDMSYDTETKELIVLTPSSIKHYISTLNGFRQVAHMYTALNFQRIVFRSPYIIIDNKHVSPVSQVLCIKQDTSGNKRILEVLYETSAIIFSDCVANQAFISFESNKLSYYTLSNEARKAISKPYFPLASIDPAITAINTKNIDKIVSVPFKN